MGLLVILFFCQYRRCRARISCRYFIISNSTAVMAAKTDSEIIFKAKTKAATVAVKTGPELHDLDLEI